MYRQGLNNGRRGACGIGRERWALYGNRQGADDSKIAKLWQAPLLGLRHHSDEMRVGDTEPALVFALMFVRLRVLRQLFEMGNFMCDKACLRDRKQNCQ